jgi:hypothetical protein
MLDDDDTLKIVDFGCSLLMEGDDIMKTTAGT